MTRRRGPSRLARAGVTALSSLAVLITAPQAVAQLPAVTQPPVNPVPAVTTPTPVAEAVEPPAEAVEPLPVPASPAQPPASQPKPPPATKPAAVPEVSKPPAEPAEPVVSKPAVPVVSKPAVPVVSKPAVPDVQSSVPQVDSPVPQVSTPVTEVVESQVPALSKPALPDLPKTALPEVEPALRDVVPAVPELSKPEAPPAVLEVLDSVALPELPLPDAPVDVEPVARTVDQVVGRATQDLGDRDDLLSGILGGGAGPPLLEPPVLADSLGPIGTVADDLLQAEDLVGTLLPLRSEGTGGLLPLPVLLNGPSSSPRSDARPAGSMWRSSPRTSPAAPAGGTAQGGTMHPSSGTTDGPRRSGGVSGRLPLVSGTTADAETSRGAQGSAAGTGGEAADAALANRPASVPANGAPGRSHGARTSPEATPQPAPPLAGYLAYTQAAGAHTARFAPAATLAAHASQGTSGASPDSPQPAAGSGASSAAAAAAAAGLFALLLSLAALALRLFARLQLAPVRWRPQAFVAVLERPG